MIEDISNVMKELDNYSLCYKVKDKYNVDNFEIKNVTKILKNKDSKRYLYDFFSEIMNNDQVNYLLEIQVLNKENYNKISDKILPKLKENIEKNTKKETKNMER